jgi:hypothetical protein
MFKSKKIIAKTTLISMLVGIIIPLLPTVDSFADVRISNHYEIGDTTKAYNYPDDSSKSIQFIPDIEWDKIDGRIPNIMDGKTLNGKLYKLINPYDIIKGYKAKTVELKNALKSVIQNEGDSFSYRNQSSQTAGSEAHNRIGFASVNSGDAKVNKEVEEKLRNLIYGNTIEHWKLFNATINDAFSNINGRFINSGTPYDVRFALADLGSPQTWASSKGILSGSQVSLFDTAVGSFGDGTIMYSFTIMPDDSNNDKDTLLFLCTFKGSTFTYDILRLNGLTNYNDKLYLSHYKYESNDFVIFYPSMIENGDTVSASDFDLGWIYKAQELTNKSLIKGVWINSGTPKKPRYDIIYKAGFLPTRLYINDAPDGDSTVLDLQIQVYTTLRGYLSFDNEEIYYLGKVNDTDETRNFGYNVADLQGSKNSGIPRPSYDGSRAIDIYRDVLNGVGDKLSGLSGKDITFDSFISKIKSNGKKNLRPYELATLEAFFNSQHDNLKAHAEVMANQKAARSIDINKGVAAVAANPIQAITEIAIESLNSFDDVNNDFRSTLFIPSKEPFSIGKKNNERAAVSKDNVSMNMFTGNGQTKIEFSNSAKVSGKGKDMKVSGLTGVRHTGNILPVITATTVSGKTKLDIIADESSKKNSNFTLDKKQSETEAAQWLMDSGKIDKSKFHVFTIDDYIDSIKNVKEYRQQLIQLSGEYRYAVDQYCLANSLAYKPTNVISKLYELNIGTMVWDNKGKQRLGELGFDEKSNYIYTDLSREIKFGFGKNTSTIHDFAREELNGMKLPTYTWSKLWVAQYSYELALYNINAMTFGYYERDSEEGSDDVRVVSNQIKAPTFFAETNTNFTNLYANNPIIDGDAELKKAALTYLPSYVPKMNAFPEVSIFSLQSKGTEGNNGGVTSSQNSPYYNFVKILHETASAFEISYDIKTDTDERGYSPDVLETKLKEWEKKNKDYQNETFDNNDISIGMVKSVISLDKLCTLLQIPKGGWTPYIDAYRKDSLVEACKKYKDNTMIENATVSLKSATNPLGMFFDVEKKALSTDWMKGFAMSALYTPIASSLNNAYTTDYLNRDNWIKDFYYRYGFYRKALYIDTNNSSVVDRFITGATGSRRIATLNDLINYDRDISLYIDDNFYNMDKVEGIINKLSTEEKLDEGTSTNKDKHKDDTSNLKEVNPPDNTEKDLSSEPASGSAVSTDGAVEATEDKKDEKSTTEKKGDTEDEKKQTGSITLPNKLMQLVGIEPVKVLAESKQVIENMLGLVPEALLKSLDVRYYKDDITNSILRIDGKKNNASGKHLYERYILRAPDIERIMKENEYSVRQPYAVLSTVYRSPSLYNEIQKAISHEQPVFMSSKNIIDVPTSTPKEYVSYMNYIMLANLEDAMNNDIKTELDKNSPIFIDIFGNIITQSGTVIIPAASNATILGERWIPTSVGFGTYYNGPNKIPFNVGTEDFKEWLTGMVETYEDVSTVNGVDNRRVLVTKVSEKYLDHDKGSGWFIKGNNHYLLKNTTISSLGGTAIIMWRTLSKNSEQVRKALYNAMYYNVAPKLYSEHRVNHIVEVLRGAPIENIDFKKEGIVGTNDVSALEMKVAYGYERLMELTSPVISSTVTNMPNLAFVSGIEYVILYIYKLMFVAFIIIFIFTLYINAVKKNLSIMTFVKFVGMVLMVTMCLTIIPDILSYSYYIPCRELLKDEVSYVTMMNYNRQFTGTELGVTQIASPKSTTKLYIKVDNMRVDWSRIVTKVLFNYTATTLNELYKEEFDKNLISKQKGIVHKGDRLYMDVNDVLNSVRVIYNPDTRMLEIKNYAEDGNVLSYVSPYYVVLNELVQSINTYNAQNEVMSYNVQTSATGLISTNDVITAYLSSPEFLSEDYDVTGFHKIYETVSAKLPTNDYSYYNGASDIHGEIEGDMSKMRKSLWFSTRPEQENYDNVELLAKYAREYVANNITTLGKVPDESFLKIMALNIAMKHNDLYKVDAARAIEISNLDSSDIMRFMIGEKGDVYKTFNFTFPRATFELGGGHSVVVAIILTLVMYITTFMKPMLIAMILVMLIVNIIVNSLFRKDESKAKVIEGFLVTCGLIITVNGLYALGIMGSVKFAQLRFGTMTNLLLSTFIQVVYMVLLGFIFFFTIRDYKEIGFSYYRHVGAIFASAFNNMFGSGSVNSRDRRRLAMPSIGSMFSKNDRPSTSNVEDEEDMKERDRRRAEEARLNRK